VTYLNKHFRQGRVADPEPTTRSDAISLVLKLLWTHLKKVFEAKECDEYT